MIEEPKKLRVRRPNRRPTAAQIEAFQGVPTGFVVDAQWGVGGLDARICPVSDCPARQVAGPALTAGNRPGDILGTLASLRFVQPGDVVIATAQGHQGCAATGDRVCAMAQNAGAAAIVTDGPVRDVDGILEVGLPLWCTGLTPNSPFSTGPAEVGLPVLIGGQHVETGDMIVADADGVVVVPFDRIDAVIFALDRVRVAEEQRDRAVQDGLVATAEIDDLLASDATVFLD